MMFNVTINDGAVVIVKPLDKTRAIVYTAAYLTAVSNIYWRSAWEPGWNLALAAAITAAWLYLMAGLRVVTWIEPWATGVRRRNLFFLTSFIPYERIAKVGTVTGHGPFAGGMHFVLVDKNNPLGKGYPLTRRMDPKGPEFDYFNGIAVPAVNAVIFGAVDGPGVDAEEEAAARGIPPECVEYYTKSGSMFSRRGRPLRAKLALFGSGFLFIMALFILTQRHMNGGDATAILGLIAFLFGAAQVSVFSIDVEKGEILFASWFGWGVRRIPLDGAVQLQAERSYGNFMYTGTRLLVRYNTKWLKCEHALGSGHFSTKGLIGLERETRLLLAAAYANRQKNEGKEPGDSPFLDITLSQGQDVKL